MSSSKRFSFNNFSQNSIMFMVPSEVSVYGFVALIVCVSFFKCDLFGHSFLIRIIIWVTKIIFLLKKKLFSFNVNP